jgi:hypothetical protein
MNYPKLGKEIVWLTCTHECFPTKDWRPMKKYKISQHPKRSFRCPTFSTSFSQVFQAMSQIIWALWAALKVHNSSSVKSQLYLLVWQVNIVQLITKTYKGKLQNMSKKILFFWVNMVRIYYIQQQANKLSSKTTPNS